MGYKLTGAYIGTQQVRPKTTQFTYSYDFKWKTASQITTDGWTYDNTPSFDSDGMYYSSRATRPRKVLWENLNNAKKVTQTYWFKTNSSSNALRAWVMTVWLNNCNWFYVESNNNQQIQLDGSAIVTQSASKSNWTYTETIVFDFENKTYDATGYFTASWSLTDAQITQIKTSTWVQFIVAYSWMRLQTVSLTIDY